MIGAIIGDVVGSRFEFNNHLSKDFEFFHRSCRFTDDTVMTCAVAKALILVDGDWEKLTPEFVAQAYQNLGGYYPSCGFGGRFFKWMFSAFPKPYGSCGNGSAMRISPVGFVARSEEECKELTYKMTVVSHDHPEGIKGAECTAMCIYLAKCGKSKEEIKRYVEEHYYKLDKTLEDYRKENAGQHGKELCQIAVPQAIRCFLDGNSFEDVIRNCVSIGGDTDTVGAIAGGIAEAFYGVPETMADEVLEYLDEQLYEIVRAFSNTRICCKTARD